MNRYRHLMQGRLGRVALVFFLVWTLADFCVMANLPVLRLSATVVADGISVRTTDDETLRCPFRNGTDAPMLAFALRASAPLWEPISLTTRGDVRLTGTTLDPPSPVPIVS